jgi:hypothetical protein
MACLVLTAEVFAGFGGDLKCSFLAGSIAGVLGIDQVAGMFWVGKYLMKMCFTVYVLSALEEDFNA